MQPPYREVRFGRRQHRGGGDAYPVPGVCRAGGVRGCQIWEGASDIRGPWQRKWNRSLGPLATGQGPGCPPPLQVLLRRVGICPEGSGGSGGVRPAPHPLPRFAEGSAAAAKKQQVRPPPRHCAPIAPPLRPHCTHRPGPAPGPAPLQPPPPRPPPPRPAEAPSPRSPWPLPGFLDPPMPILVGSSMFRRTKRYPGPRPSSPHPTLILILHPFPIPILHPQPSSLSIPILIPSPSSFSLHPFSILIPILVLIPPSSSSFILILFHPRPHPSSLLLHPPSSFICIL